MVTEWNRHYGANISALYHFYSLRVISHMGRRIDEMMQFISYMVKNGVTVTIGTYIGRNLCHYSHIARNELKKSTTLNCNYSE